LEIHRENEKIFVPCLLGKRLFVLLALICIFVRLFFLLIVLIYSIHTYILVFYLFVSIVIVILQKLLVFHWHGCNFNWFANISCLPHLHYCRRYTLFALFIYLFW